MPQTILPAPLLAVCDEHGGPRPVPVGWVCNHLLAGGQTWHAATAPDGVPAFLCSVCDRRARGQMPGALSDRQASGPLTGDALVCMCSACLDSLRQRDAAAVRLARPGEAPNLRSREREYLASHSAVARTMVAQVEGALAAAGAVRGALAGGRWAPGWDPKAMHGPPPVRGDGQVNAPAAGLRVLQLSLRIRTDAARAAADLRRLAGSDTAAQQLLARLDKGSAELRDVVVELQRILGKDAAAAGQRSRAAAAAAGRR